MYRNMSFKENLNRNIVSRSQPEMTNLLNMPQLSRLLKPLMINGLLKQKLTFIVSKLTI